jgi:CheY-like chemotaxis protein
VEDDRMNRLVITKMLSDWNLDSAEDGDITIKKIDQAYKEGTIYDLMLFDINLPNPWDGIKLMHHIKKKYPEYKEIPFIAQTAYAMRGDKERLLEEGFDDYLSKPISQQRLLTSMYKFLSKEGE